MKISGISGVISALVILSAINSPAAPVDHVYVSNEQVDKLNLDGSLDMNFLSPNSDTCRALAVDGNSGNVWLGCENNATVLLFSLGGAQLNSQVTLGINGQVCVDPYGNSWFTDRPNGVVRKFNSSGTYINGYSVGGTAPSAIVCDRFGNVWTANQSTNNISKLNNNGNLISTYGPFGNLPRALASDNYGNIYLTSNPDNLFILDNNGSQLNNFHPVSGAPGIALDQNNNIWITSDFSDVVVKMSIGGSILGSFPVTNPYDITIDTSGNIWLVQRTNSTITKISNNGTNLGTFPLSGNSGQNDTGYRYQRFVLGFNSVEVPNVWVPLNGGAPEGALTLTFSCISSKGNSSYTESGTGTQPPAGFKLGTPPRYYDITTTAVYTSCNVEVCVGYNETEFTNEGALKLFHNSGAWADVTTSLDTTNNIICGSVTSLSEFAIMEPEDAGDIPAVSEWVLILMGALLLAAMAWRLRRNPCF